jgi:hypothetical protein
VERGSDRILGTPEMKAFFAQQVEPRRPRPSTEALIRSEIPKYAKIVKVPAPRSIDGLTNGPH